MNSFEIDTRDRILVTQHPLFPALMFLFFEPDEAHKKSIELLGARILQDTGVSATQYSLVLAEQAPVWSELYAEHNSQLQISPAAGEKPQMPREWTGYCSCWEGADQSAYEMLSQADRDEMDNIAAGGW